MVVDARFYMDLVVSEAWKYQGLTFPNPAVGCCVVGIHGEILAINAHQKAGQPHAEVMALKDAYFMLTQDKNILKFSSSVDIHKFLLENHNNIFKNATIYTTLEPCSHIGKTPSCASLIASLGIQNIYVGTNDFNQEASCGNTILRDANLSVYENILSKKANDLVEPFKAFHHNKFVFFKWAQRLDASVDNGIVSSQESREHVHALRDVCDLLVIGGNTVRTDRPTLDARLVDGKAPDILILSKTKEFDKSIPLFSVLDRKVFIEDNLSKVNNYKNIMVEGGATMYELTKTIVDWYLCYIAPTFGGDKNFSGLNQERFEILHTTKNKQDIILWMKREQ